MSDIDYVEVSRKCHELTATHGATALQYAERLAKEALAKGNQPEADFWAAVATGLKPR